MTVAELIDRLQHIDPALQVVLLVYGKDGDGPLQTVGTDVFDRDEGKVCVLTDDKEQG